MKQCPACGANNSSDQPSCSICGAALSQVADSAAARTLFGMPALKFGEGPADAEPAAEPEPAPEPAADAADRPGQGRSAGPGTRPGFRALDAFEFDGSVGSMNVRPDAASLAASEPPPAVDPASEAMRSTQFGAPSPFKAGQLPPIGTGDPGHEPEPEPAAAPDAILSTQFGSPKAVRTLKPGAAQAAAPSPAIDSTRMGMPTVNVDGDAPADEAPAGDEQQYRTLVGPPLPLAEAARARAEAKAAAEAEAEAQAENYRTLVGPPVPIAEAARARDAAKARVKAKRDASAAAAGPSVIVDGGLGGAEPSVIVDEPVQPRGARSPAADGNRSARPPGAAEVTRPSDHAVRDAASRFAAAMDTDERTAMVVTVKPRSYTWVFLVLIVVGVALAVWLTRDAHAFQVRIDSVEATPTPADAAPAVEINAEVVADRPVKVSLAGRDAPPTVVDGQGAVRFVVPLDGLEPGEHAFDVQVSTDEGETALPVALTLWMRAEVQPVEGLGQPARVALTVRPGWQPAPPFERVPGQSGHYQARVDPQPAMAEVDAPGGLTASLTVPVVLRAEDDAERRFELAVDVPLPRTPLLLTAPARAWRRDAETVVVSGRTAPGALVKVGAMNALADDAGAFSMTVPLSAARQQDLEVSADGEGARPTVRRVSVERLTPAAGVAQAAAQRARQEERRATLGRTPPYARWLSGSEALRGRSVAFRGRLVAVERGAEHSAERAAADRADRAVVAACDTGDHCPVWVTTHSPILVEPGQWVSVSGSLAGTETWRAAERFVTAPRVEGALLAP